MEKIDELKALMDLRDILSLLSPQAWQYAQSEIIAVEHRRRQPKPKISDDDQARVLHELQSLSGGRQ
jgi:hypothetical protein